VPEWQEVHDGVDDDENERKGFPVFDARGHARHGVGGRLL